MTAADVARRVAAIVVSYNTRDLLLEAVGSLQSAGLPQTIVVDNASADGSADVVETRFPDITVIRSSTNLGFAAGVNRGVQAAGRAEYLLLLNPDATLDTACVDLLLNWLDRHPRAAAVGSALIYGDGCPQDSAFRFPGLGQVFLDLFPIPRLGRSWLNGRYSPATEPFRIDHPLGACLLIRRSAWDDVGPLDEGFFMYVEEVDWCRRARARGWEIWSHPRALSIHHGARSTRQSPNAMFVQLWRSRLRYYRKYHGAPYNALVQLLVRLGMRAEARRARRTHRGPELAARLAALREIRALAR